MCHLGLDVHANVRSCGLVCVCVPHFCTRCVFPLFASMWRCHVLKGERGSLHSYLCFCRRWPTVSTSVPSSLNKGRTRNMLSLTPCVAHALNISAGKILRWFNCEYPFGWHGNSFLDSKYLTLAVGNNGQWSVGLKKYALVYPSSHRCDLIKENRESAAPKVAA